MPSSVGPTVKVNRGVDSGAVRAAPLPTHIFIPDTQCDPGTPTAHLEWIGAYIAEKFQGREAVKIIHAGDHWNLGSLSSYDKKGSRAKEGRRVEHDIMAGNRGMRLLSGPLDALHSLQEARRRTWLAALACQSEPDRWVAGHPAPPDWTPERYLLRGNHEYRRERYIEENPELEGALPDFDDCGWVVVPFLQPLWLDGVAYAHYFYNPMTGRPYGGMPETRLKNVGHSFTMGHQQGYKHATLSMLTATGPRLRHGLIAGSCYLHDEQYMGFQGNAYWRGIIVCYGVEDGSYDPKFVSLDSLCRRYEGVPLSTFMPGIGTNTRAMGVQSGPENPSALNNNLV